MTIKGVDYAWAKPPVAALKAAGIQFAARYLSPDASKNLTTTETAALLAAGISIVVVWESTAARILGGKPAGTADAAAAISQARACGLTDPVVIYFACDYDASEADQPAINAYLDGAAAVLGRDFTGIYGGYWPITRARAAGKAVWYWGTYAWSGTNWDTCGWRPHIMQALGTAIYGGVTCDIDTAAVPDYGQWPRPSTPTPPEPPMSTTGPASWDAADWAAITAHTDMWPLVWILARVAWNQPTTGMTATQKAWLDDLHRGLANMTDPAALAAAIVAALGPGTIDAAAVEAGVTSAMAHAFPTPPA